MVQWRKGLDMKIEYSEMQIREAKKNDVEPGDICPNCGEFMDMHPTCDNGYRRYCPSCRHEE